MTVPVRRGHGGSDVRLRTAKCVIGLRMGHSIWRMLAEGCMLLKVRTEPPRRITFGGEREELEVNSSLAP